jgi:hypothetical protein
MAHVVAFIPDLLFGSRVQASLRSSGHTVDLVGDESGVRNGLTGADVLVLDLTQDPARRAGLLESLSLDSLAGVHTIAFYSHVDLDARRVAEKAAFDLIVPRSRMAREGAELVTRLLLPG